MKEVKCFHQVFRPTIRVHIEGFGDCIICQPDPENNKKCRGYQPTTMKSIVFCVHKKVSAEEKEASES